MVVVDGVHWYKRGLADLVPFHIPTATSNTYNNYNMLSIANVRKSSTTGSIFAYLHASGKTPTSITAHNEQKIAYTKQFDTRRKSSSGDIFTWVKSSNVPRVVVPVASNNNYRRKSSSGNVFSPKWIM